MAPSEAVRLRGTPSGVFGPRSGSYLTAIRVIEPLTPSLGPSPRFFARFSAARAGVVRLERSSPAHHRVDEIGDHGRHAIGRFDELDARSVDHDVLVDVADAAVRDPALHDDRAVAKREAEFVEGIQLQGKVRFYLRPVAADFLDGGRLEDHDLAMELAEDVDALSIALI